MHIIRNTVRKVLEAGHKTFSSPDASRLSRKGALVTKKSFQPRVAFSLAGGLGGSSMCKYILIHFKLFFFAVILGLQKSKDSTGFPYNLHLTLSNRNILCNRDIFIPNEKLTFTYTINYITGFLCIPRLFIFLFLDPVQATMLHLVLSLLSHL